jgi:hypothetical protein
MSSRDIRFADVMVERLDSQLVIVTGRNIGDPLPKGYLFTVVYGMTPILDAEKWFAGWNRVNERAIALRVRTIWAIGHTLEQLDRGWTGMLELVGSGGALLGSKSVPNEVVVLS